MLEVKLQMKLQQKLVMTPQLQLAIKLLQMSRLELADEIRKELEENPLLEEGTEGLPEKVAGQEEGPDQPAAADSDGDRDEAAADTPDEVSREDMLDWDDYLNDGRDLGYAPREVPDQILYENTLRATQSLQDYLIWQLQMRPLDERDLRIAEQIVGNLDSNGYLRSSVEEIAQTLGATVEEVEQVLTHVQACDPTGVAARSVQECLLLQLARQEDETGLASRIVRDHLELVAQRAIPDLARLLGVSNADVNKAIETIRRLDPKPGRHYATESTRYVVPDVYIRKVDGEYRILLNDTGLPHLRISSLYRRLLSDEAAVSDETKAYVEKKVSSAMWLMKSVQQRQRTIYKVAESILQRQRAFFDHGISHLKPMVLRDVAEDIGVHESTVSRVSTNKYMHTPRGIFEIKWFFQSGISRAGGPDIASLRVKEMVKEIIAAENKRKPLSDQAIVRQLRERGIVIARRTVAKYREDLGILPSSKRKQYV